jgi:hypothetical protein
MTPPDRTFKLGLRAARFPQHDHFNPGRVPRVIKSGGTGTPDGPDTVGAILARHILGGADSDLIAKLRYDLLDHFEKTLLKEAIKFQTALKEETGKLLAENRALFLRLGRAGAWVRGEHGPSQDSCGCENDVARAAQPDSEASRRESLEREVSRLKKEAKGKDKIIEALQARVRQLEMAGKIPKADPDNSSLPPSKRVGRPKGGDGRKPRGANKPKSGRGRGGVPGHEGNFRIPFGRQSVTQTITHSYEEGEIQCHQLNELSLIAK